MVENQKRSSSLSSCVNLWAEWVTDANRCQWECLFNDARSSCFFVMTMIIINESISRDEIFETDDVRQSKIENTSTDCCSSPLLSCIPFDLTTIRWLSLPLIKGCAVLISYRHWSFDGRSFSFWKLAVLKVTGSYAKDELRLAPFRIMMIDK